MTVWYDDHADDWRTDFPPPADFWGHAEGQFGDPAYARALDDDELEVYETLRAAEVTPLLIAGEAARRAFFARLDPANDASADPAGAGDCAGSGRTVSGGGARYRSGAGGGALQSPCSAPI